MSFELSDIVAEFEIELKKETKIFEKNLNDFSIRKNVNLLSFDGETYPIIPPWLFDRVLGSLVRRRAEQENWRETEINLKNKLFDSGFVYLCRPKKFIHMDRNKLRELK